MPSAGLTLPAAVTEASFRSDWRYQTNRPPTTHDVPAKRHRRTVCRDGRVHISDGLDYSHLPLAQRHGWTRLYQRATREGIRDLVELIHADAAKLVKTRLVAASARRSTLSGRLMQPLDVRVVSGTETHLVHSEQHLAAAFITRGHACQSRTPSGNAAPLIPCGWASIHD